MTTQTLSRAAVLILTVSLFACSRAPQSASPNRILPDPVLEAQDEPQWLSNAGFVAVNQGSSSNAAVLIDGQTGPDDMVAWAPGWFFQNQYPLSAYVDLGRNYDLSALRFFQGNNSAGAEVELSTAPDSSTPGSSATPPQSWTPLLKASSGAWNTWVSRSFAPVRARYVRLSFGWTHKFNLSEVQFSGTPSSAPIPSSGFTAQDAVTPYVRPFQYGVNPGYYGDLWSDTDIYQLSSDAGSRSTRSTMPDFFLANNGPNIRAAEFRFFFDTLGFRENTLFIEGPRDPRRAWQGVGSDGQPVEDWCDHTTDVNYGSVVQCKLWKGMDQPIWRLDSSGAKSVNPDNKMALYLEQVLKNYGAPIRFFEVINEPDIVGDYRIPEKWCTQAPTREELSQNLNADVFQYIRALRISYEVVKHYQPDAYVAPGGTGYSCFLDALLRYTDNPDGGKVSSAFPRTGGAYFDVVSFHSYPQFGAYAWNNAKGGFDYFRHSDRMVQVFGDDLEKHQAVLKKYGYDGSKYPTKPIIVTETGLPRIGIGESVGGEEVQRNYLVKALVKAQQWGIGQVYWYGLGDGKPLSSIESDTDALNNASGLYAVLNGTPKGSQQLTPAGVAHRTLSAELLGWAYDAAATQALQLPSSADGAAFRRGASLKYALWARTSVDRSEVAQTSLNLPGSFDVVRWDSSRESAVSGVGLTLSASPAFYLKR